MRFKRVCRYDSTAQLFRLFRVIWTRGRGPGVGGPRNYDAKLSLALCRPRWRLFRRECDGWRLWLLLFRIHYQRSYGGRMS